jgi:hypothetical protein
MLSFCKHPNGNRHQWTIPNLLLYHFPKPRRSDPRRAAESLGEEKDTQPILKTLSALQEKCPEKNAPRTGGIHPSGKSSSRTCGLN